MNNIPYNERNSEEAKELLLADLKYLNESFWKNEEIGETRVRFFITLVAAVLTALATISGIKNDIINVNYKFIISVYTLIALLILGIITLLRILKRNSVTDGYKKGMDKIREQFKIYFDPSGKLSLYDPFSKPIKESVFRRKIGGLAYTVASLNSIIVLAIAGLILYKFYTALCISVTIELHLFILIISIIIALSIFFLSFYIQFKFIKHSDNRGHNQIFKSDFTHGGGLVARFDKNKISYLIITAKDNPDHWVFPKGHIENGENEEATAEREVMEETGIEAKTIEPVGST